MQLFTAVNRQGVVFLWPVRLQQEKGRRSEWNSSALAAADLAMVRWVRVTANMGLGAYEVFYAEGALDEPEWPDCRSKNYWPSPSSIGSLIASIMTCSAACEGKHDPVRGTAVSSSDPCRLRIPAPPGERPHPICCLLEILRRVERLGSGRTSSTAGDEHHTPPSTTRYSLPTTRARRSAVSSRSGWSAPMLVLDLFTEFRTLTKREADRRRQRVLGALIHHGLDAMGATEKEEMRNLALRGGPWSRANGPRCSTTVRLMCSRWRTCSMPCCRGSISGARCFADGSWSLWRAWSIVACPSMCRCCRRSGRTGTHSRSARSPYRSGLRRLRRTHVQNGAMGSLARGARYPLASARIGCPGTGRRHL